MDEVREKAVVVSGLRRVLVHIRVALGGTEWWWKACKMCSEGRPGYKVKEREDSHKISPRTAF